MCFKSKCRLVLAIVMACAGLSVRAWPLGVLRIVHETPVATIERLHELHLLTPEQPTISEKLWALPPESLAAIGRGESLAPRHFEGSTPLLKPTPLVPLGKPPAVDITRLSEHLGSQLMVYQRERGLPATGMFDAATSAQLQRDALDRQGMALAKRTVGGDAQVAILRRDTSNGMLWRLSVEGRSDVQFNALDRIGADLVAPSGARPVVFVAATDSTGVNKIQSSLRLTDGQFARVMPIVLKGEPSANLALLRPERIEPGALARRIAEAPLLRDGQTYFKEVDFHAGTGDRVKFSLWASSKEGSLRLVAAFIAFTALHFPHSESVAAFAARFRDYLFDNGYDFDQVGIGFGEPLTRQWAALAPRPEAGLA